MNAFPLSHYALALILSASARRETRRRLKMLTLITEMNAFPLSHSALTLILSASASARRDENT